MWKPPETPTTPRPSVHSSLHWLTSSHAYLLIKLQGLPARRDAVSERRMTTQWKKTAHRWFISLSVFKIAQMLRFFFFLDLVSWHDCCLMDSGDCLNSYSVSKNATYPLWNRNTDTLHLIKWWPSEETEPLAVIKINTFIIASMFNNMIHFIHLNKWLIFFLNHLRALVQ